MTSKKALEQSETKLREIEGIVGATKKLVVEIAKYVEKVRVIAEDEARHVRHTTDHPIMSSPTMNDVMELGVAGDRLEGTWRDVARLSERLSSCLTEARAHAVLLAEAIKPRAE